MIINNLFTVIWLIFDETRAKKVVPIINQILEKNQESNLIIVWNGTGDFNKSILNNLKFEKTNLHFTSSDNIGREFSGYQAGLDLIKGVAEKGVLFINDTAGVHNYLPRFFIRSLNSTIARVDQSYGVCIGHIDRALQLLKLYELTSEKWVRTNLFYLNQIALQKLDWKIFSPEINELVNETSIDHFFSDSLDNSMKIRISNWLFRKTSNSWYGACPLCEDNLSFMAGKARSIFQEYYLSMRILSTGCYLYGPELNTASLLWYKLCNRIGRIIGIIK